MCVVSYVHDYMSKQVPITYWTPPVFDEYKDILERLARLDEHLNQPDCESPEKAAYLKKIEERLARLEKKTKKKKCKEEPNNETFTF